MSKPHNHTPRACKIQHFLRSAASPMRLRSVLVPALGTCVEVPFSAKLYKQYVV